MQMGNGSFIIDYVICNRVSISILNFFPPNRGALLDTFLRRESDEGQKTKGHGTLTPGYTPE
jgi:hypothetical protein